MTLDPKQIGERLRELRTYLRMTRRDLEDVTLIPQATIRSWEEGRVAIRPHNIDKYLQELTKLGCSATIEWVLYGDKKFLYRQHNEKFLWLSSKYDIGKVGIDNILVLLQMTSNLFYYLDINENVVCVNKKFLFCLDHADKAVEDINLNIEFKKLCSDDIYDICHKHFVLCKQENKMQTFSYVIGTQYSKQKIIVDMLYWPLTEGIDRPVHSVLGFISTNTLPQDSAEL